MNELTPIRFLADAPVVVGPIVINPGGDVLVKSEKVRLEESWRMLLSVLASTPNIFFNEAFLCEALQHVKPRRPTIYSIESVGSCMARLKRALNQAHPGTGYLIKSTGIYNRGPRSGGGSRAAPTHYKIVIPSHERNVTFGPFETDLATGRTTRRIAGRTPEEVFLPDLERELLLALAKKMGHGIQKSELRRTLYEDLACIGIPIPTEERIMYLVRELRNSLDNAFPNSSEHIVTVSGGHALISVPDLKKALRPKEIKRWQTFANERATLIAGDLDFDPDTFALRHENKIIKLGFMEGVIFTMLLKSWGQYFTRVKMRQNIAAITGGKPPDKETVRSNIKSLQAKIRRLVGYDCIHFAAPPEEVGRIVVAMANEKPEVPFEIAKLFVRRRVKVRSNSVNALRADGTIGSPHNPQSPARILALS